MQIRVFRQVVQKKIKSNSIFFFALHHFSHECVTLLQRINTTHTQLNEVELVPGTADNSHIGGPLTDDGRCCFLGWIVGTLALSTLCLAIGESLVLQLMRE